MDNTNPFADNHSAGQETPWSQAADFVKEERPIHQVQVIENRGSTDIVFFRCPRPYMVVGAESAEVLRDLKTRIQGDKLVIERTGTSGHSAGGAIHVSGTNNIIVGGDYHGYGQSSGRTAVVAGQGSVVVGQGRGIVGIALPELPWLRIKGRGDANLYGLDQESLELDIEGSGDIEVLGRVERLMARIAGSGDIDASELQARTAELLIAGSGDIDALVSEAITARIAGSGDIVVRGKPLRREQAVAGSGTIKFK